MAGPLENDLARWKAARAKSIVAHYGSSRATEDGIKALRSAVIEDCKNIINARIAKLKQEKARDNAAVGRAIDELDDMLGALDRLKS